MRKPEKKGTKVQVMTAREAVELIDDGDTLAVCGAKRAKEFDVMALQRIGRPWGPRNVTAGSKRHGEACDRRTLGAVTASG